MEIDKKLLDEIRDYCYLNKLKIGTFVNDLLRKAFNNEKFGDKPLVYKQQNRYFTDNVKEVVEEGNINFIKTSNYNDSIIADTEDKSNTIEKNASPIPKEVKRRKLN